MIMDGVLLYSFTSALPRNRTLGQLYQAWLVMGSTLAEDHKGVKGALGCWGRHSISTLIRSKILKKIP